MTNASLQRLLEHKRTAVVVGGLLTALVLALYAKPGWACHDSGQQDCSNLNPPSIEADNPSVTVDEGQEATNSGTWSDQDGEVPLITASVGTVTQSFEPGNGTWSWSYTPDDGPLTETVEVRALDSDPSHDTSVWFDLTVDNLVPTATFNAPQTSYSGKTFVVSMTDQSDPSSADEASLTYAFDCGSGYEPIQVHSTASCVAGSGPTQTVKGKIRDKDGEETEYTRIVAISEDAPPSLPNGKIAFERVGEIYTMNPDGSGQTRLSEGMDPAFSPDGEKIAFWTFRDDIPGDGRLDSQIYVMNADGSNPTRLTTTQTQERYPAWSPDGSKIAFASTRDGTWDIFAMNPDGSGQTNLSTNLSGDEVRPSWGPGGNAAPETTITSGPNGPTNVTTPTFTFDGDDDLTDNADLRFSHKVDDGEWSPYSFQTSATLASLLEGDHTFYVKAKDAQGLEDPSPAQQSFTVDTTAPVTTIDSFEVKGDDARFDFSSTDTDVDHFECSLDGTNYQECSSPKTYENLGDGAYTFHVRAVDQASNEGVPDTQGFVIDTQAPDTTITSGPNGLTDDDTPTFSFGGSDDKTAVEKLRFFYRLDGGDWTEASSTSVTLPSLPDGPHTFSVKAVDEAGNEDGSPAERSFTVEKRAPRVETTNPIHEGTNAPRLADITATFSEPINRTTLNPSTIKMQVGKKKVPVAVKSLSSDGKTGTIDPYPTDPSTELAPNKKYKVTITTGVQDLQGKALDQDPAKRGNQPKVWTFTTGP